MNTTTTVLGTAGVVAAAKWTNDKSVDLRFALGLAVMALFLALITETNPSLAEKLGTLVFVTAILIYGPVVAEGFGLIKKGAGGPRK